MKIVLTNNAKFNPYTFDEMLKPLAMAADAYNAVQSGIEELGAKADLMKKYLTVRQPICITPMLKTWRSKLVC